MSTIDFENFNTKGFINPKDAWDNLSLKEKASMIGVAVRNGVTNLKDIRAKYNEFAEGGYTDADVVDRIIQEEGFNAKPEDIGDGKITLGSGLTSSKWHDLYKKRGNKWSAEDNRRAVTEEVANRRRWAEKNIPNWDTLPESSQKALLSYKYNYDFNRANSPKLFKALEAGNLQEAARQMDATSKDPKFKKGLQARRKREQDWFLSDVVAEPRVPNTPFEKSVSTTVYNPYVQQVENTRIAPVMVPDEDSYVTAHRLTDAEEKKQRFQKRMEAINNFNRLMELTSVENTATPAFVPTTGNALLDGIMGLTRAEGGKIHIKDSKKGTFTAAASKHGMGVQEFASRVLAHKENYSPAMVKKANFAMNAKKFKHGFGGPLVDIAMANMYGNGGDEEITAFTPIAKPSIPTVEGDQEAVNWIANWYNNRREQMYNNLRNYGSTFWYDMKDRLTGNPVGRRAINHDYYDKLNNMAQYKTATFEDLERDNTASYDTMYETDPGYTVPETMKVYYNNDLIDELSFIKREEGFSPEGVHIHERIHTTGKTGEDGKFTGYNVQTKALENILKLKPGLKRDEYLDASPEIYGRMMEFRYNHNLNPKKKYTKDEIQKFLDKEKYPIYRSELQRYDIDTLTKALNEVAQNTTSKASNFDNKNLT